MVYRRWMSVCSPVQTISNDRHDHHHCHIEFAPVMVVTVVMVTAYCYGRGMHTCPGKTGPSWPKANTGGASAALRHRPNRKQGLQGLRFALGGVGQQAESPVSVGVCGMERNRVAANPGAYPVCRFASRPRENGQGRKFNAGAGLRLICCLDCRNRPTSAFAPRLTHRTQVVVTFREARARARV